MKKTLFGLLGLSIIMCNFNNSRGFPLICSKTLVNYWPSKQFVLDSSSVLTRRIGEGHKENNNNNTQCIALEQRLKPNTESTSAQDKCKCKCIRSPVSFAHLSPTDGLECAFLKIERRNW